MNLLEISAFSSPPLSPHLLVDKLQRNLLEVTIHEVCNNILSRTLILAEC